MAFSDEVLAVLTVSHRIERPELVRSVTVVNSVDRREPQVHVLYGRIGG